MTDNEVPSKQKCPRLSANVWAALAAGIPVMISLMVVAGYIIGTAVWDRVSDAEQAEEMKAEFQAEDRKSLILSKCQWLRTVPETPQAVADKCRTLIRDDELARDREARESLQQSYQLILNY